MRNDEPGGRRESLCREAVQASAPTKYLLNWVQADEPNSLAKRNGTITTSYKECGVLPGEIMIQAD